MATTALLPNQQQPQLQEEVPYPQAVPSNVWHSTNSSKNSGSIGPFFGVISVLAVLAVVSCLLGRFWIGKEDTPLDSVSHRGSCFGWLKRRCRRPFARGVEAGGGRGHGGKVAAAAPPPDV